MIKLTEKDIIILKESSSWGGRLYSKFKTYTSSRIYGKELRTILNKATIIESRISDIYHLLMSPKKTRAINTERALSDFAELKNVVEPIIAIIKKAIQTLQKEHNINVAAYYQQQRAAAAEAQAQGQAQPQQQQQGQPQQQGQGQLPDNEAAQKEAADRRDKLELVIGYIGEIEKSPVIEKLKTQRNSLLINLNRYYLMMTQENLSKEDFEDLYQKAKSEYENYKQQISTASPFYNELIKNASTVEAATFYYLISNAGVVDDASMLLEQGWVTTRQLVPFYRETSEMYDFRKNARDAIKELYKESEIFQDKIQEAIKEDKDFLNKWVIVINAYNSFVDSYNEKIPFFSNFYAAIARQGKEREIEEKMKKRKGKVDSDIERSIGEYSGLSISSESLQAQLASKFKPIQKIQI